MRVALLTYSTKPRGGVVHTLALAEALARTGVDVDVWTLARGGDRTFFRAVDPAVGLRPVPFPDVPGEAVGARILRSIRTLRDALRGADYDVVHAQDCISANAALAAGLRCLRTIHHLDTFTTPELVACHDRAVLEPAGHVCVSEAVAREVREQYGVQPVVIANGVDAGRFERAASSTAASQRDRWTDQLGEYVETLFDYRDYRAVFDQRAHELGVEPTLLGVVDDDALPSLVAAAQAMAFVSTKEGFGLAALEALAAGVPVVARDLPVLREVFGSTVSFASDPTGMADAFDRILSGRTDVRPGRALARSYTWDAAAQAHLQVYAGHAS